MVIYFFSLIPFRLFSSLPFFQYPINSPLLTFLHLIHSIRYFLLDRSLYSVPSSLSLIHNFFPSLPCTLSFLNLKKFSHIFITFFSSLPVYPPPLLCTCNIFFCTVYPLSPAPCTFNSLLYLHPIHLSQLYLYHLYVSQLYL